MNAPPQPEVARTRKHAPFLPNIKEKSEAHILRSGNIDSPISQLSPCRSVHMPGKTQGARLQRDRKLRHYAVLLRPSSKMENFINTGLPAFSDTS